MDNREIRISIGSREHVVFFQNGFYHRSSAFAPLHKHSYSEIHLTAEGDVEFNIAGKHHSSANGNLLIIPPNTPHCVTANKSGGSHTAFQIDVPTDSFATVHLPARIARDFFEAIALCRETGDHTVIAAYVALFCSYLKTEAPLSSTPISDVGFLICEFFSKHYNEDLTLEDLSKALHLSPRQTERLVLKHTGRTFREELTAHRTEMGRYLLANSDMSPGEISRYVGYRSYAGFWKAMKKHGDI